MYPRLGISLNYPIIFMKSLGETSELTVPALYLLFDLLLVLKSREVVIHLPDILT